jgi:hypothetical protein
MSTTGVQCGGFGTGGFGSGGFGSSPPRISGAVTSGFGSPNNAQQQTNGYHQTIGFGTPPGCGFSSITVPGGFGKSLLAPELEDDNQALADVLKKLRELLPLVNNQNFRF